MKNRSTAIVLALLLGGLGIHRFYLGRNISGFFYFIFCWTFIPALLGLLEAICFLSYSQAGWDKEYNSSHKFFSETAQKKKCPDCAEIVMAEARKCKHCGFSFDLLAETSSAQATFKENA